jgi:hypothetical protein
MMADTRFRRSALAIAMIMAFDACAFAQSPTCVSLQNQWAALNRKDAGRAGAYANAARRQMAEMQRTAAYARQLGCDNKRFLIFGSDPPPQCGPLMAKLSRMQADLASLQGQMDRLGGGAEADEQRYQLQLAMRQYCGGDQPQGGPLGAPGDLDPNRLDAPQQIDVPGGIEQGPGSGSGKPICVRLCDGYFFPLASLGSRVDAARMCQAQCPGAETEAFSMASDDIAQAVGEGGKSYMELENALRYQKATVPGCSCRKADESWGQALKPAEDMLGGSDTPVDADKAAQMSRPSPSPDPKKGPSTAKGQAPASSAASLPPVTVTGNAPLPPAQPGASRPPLAPSAPRNVRIIPPPPPPQPPQP